MGPAVRLEDRIVPVLLAEAVQVDPVAPRLRDAGGGETVEGDRRAVHDDVVPLHDPDRRGPVPDVHALEIDPGVVEPLHHLPARLFVVISDRDLVECGKLNQIQRRFTADLPRASQAQYLHRNPPSLVLPHREPPAERSSRRRLSFPSRGPPSGLPVGSASPHTSDATRSGRPQTAAAGRRTALRGEPESFCVR